MAYQLKKQTLSALKGLTLPQHVAIIMDGNGRYAEKLGQPRSYGHRQGALNLTNVCRIADAMGITYLTVYAFSTENWRRPATEVNQLFGLVKQFFTCYIDEICSLEVRLRFIGDLSALPANLQKTIADSVALTKNNQRLQLTIALNYGARQELAQACKQLALAAQGDSELLNLPMPDFCNKLASYLWTFDLPDPDLLIRTAGELRLSNFLLWQSAYAELYSTNCLWPEFGEDDLLKALVNFSKRTRKFGALPQA